jgi:hypothetical protein
MRIPVLIITIIYFIPAAFISCSNNKDNKTATTSVDTLTAGKPVTINSAVESTPSAMEDTCVFDNDYKGLTMDWVKELKASGFVWDEKMFAAIKVIDHDTILLAQGGCYHFGISAKWSTVDTHEATDSSYWITKALKFAEEYQLNDYVAFIKGGQLQRDLTSETYVRYNVIDTARYTNTLYEGISVADMGHRKRLTLSLYYN